MTILGLEPFVLGFIALAGLSVGAILYVLLFGAIENEKKRNKRLATVKSASTDSATRRKVHDKIEDTAKRRKAVAKSLDEIEEKNKARAKNINRPNLRLLLAQAGIKMDVTRFYIVSAICGVAVLFGAILYSVPFIYAIGFAFAAGLGLPRWVVSYLRKRRMKAFLDEFPNAIDVIVRAIKSGLPLNDGLRLISTEAREPVKMEFQRIIEAQQLGMSASDACARMYQSMPVPEANFFAVVIQIQASAGGNLAEALGNLSGVLRARKSMKGKVAAMSMEAKASAFIIACLPVVVAVLVSMTSPEYIMPLFTTDTGYMILGISAVWMAMGVFVMKQMINFEV